MMARPFWQGLPITEAVVHQQGVARRGDEHVAVAVAPLVEARQNLAPTPRGAVLLGKVDRLVVDLWGVSQDCFQSLNQHAQRMLWVCNNVAEIGRAHV